LSAPEPAPILVPVAIPISWQQGVIIMRKMFGLLALVVALAVVGASVVAPIGAQEKAKTKAKKDAALGTVEIYKAKDGYRFRIKDADNHVMAMPPRARETKEEVAKDLEEIKATLNKAKPTDVKD
jgi:hypothetical protein